MNSTQQLCCSSIMWNSQFKSVKLWLILVISLFLKNISANELKGKKWAFLAATSNGWINYRHQSDLCHAYQLLRQNGFPKENIVTMMYDDIANNSENPTKGVIINKPGGPNVYEGVEIDYKGKDVNVKNFFNILSGNKDEMKNIGSGRVIESGPDDHIFVYVVDHGDTGILLFPNDEYLYAHDLTQNLRQMKKDKHFAKMVMYIEACKAGSMFDNIIDDGLDVFVVTASATNEFSFATYCDTMTTCLADLFSSVWMENMDTIRENWSASFTTLFKQYKHVRTNVEKSNVMMYGDFRLGFDKASSYLGDQWKPSKKHLYTNYNATKQHTHFNIKVHSQDVSMHMLKTKIIASDNEAMRRKYLEQLDQIKKGRLIIDNIMSNIMTIIAKGDEEMYDNLVNTKQTLKEDIFPCYKNLIHELNARCYNTYKNNYATSHFYKLANICLMDIPISDYVSALQIACNVQHKYLLNTI